MKFLIQCVQNASVTVDGKTTGAIEKGFLVFIGVNNEDTTEVADRMIKKMLGLRIFEDENGKTNLSLDQVNGSLLLVSQFTLYADCKKGNRPSFVKAGNPQHANELYEYIISETKKSVSEVQTGIFGADMKVSLINDGPFTIMLDSDELF
ncbi:MAG: D-aminoacyl-tRNA deacylase [Lachnospiraceae bacterium]